MNTKAKKPTAAQASARARFAAMARSGSGKVGAAATSSKKPAKKK